MAIKFVFNIFTFLYFLQTFQHVFAVKIVSTVNLSELTVGTPFTHRCELSEFKYDHSQLYLTFHFYDGYYANFLFEGSLLNGTFSDTRNNNFLSHHYISKVTPLIHDGKVFEVSVLTNHTFENAPLFCKLYDSRLAAYVVESNKFDVSVKKATLSPLPTVTFSTNTPQIKLNTPFNVSCSVTNYHWGIGKNLSFNFYNSRDGFLASFELIKPAGTYFFSTQQHQDLTVNHGAQTAFPTFDLLITEHVNLHLNYWCEIVDLSSPTKVKVESSHVTLGGAAIDFISKPLSNGTLSGTCSIDNFEPKGKIYIIQFYSDLGKSTKNLLGQFVVQPNAIAEFDAFDNAPSWTLIHHGGSIHFPSFEIVAKPKVGSGPSELGSWWCEFIVDGEITQSLHKAKLG